MVKSLTEAQREIVARVIDQPHLAIWADMGAGKTAITLHAVSELLKMGMIKKAVVVAPRAVADSTWSQECASWDSTAWMRVSVLRGDSRTRKEQAATPAEIYCIGRDALAKKGEHRGCIASDDLMTLARDFKSTMLIVDEASSIKNPRSARFRALAFFPWGRVLELTGTPTPQGIADVWPQVYLLDRGESLGKTITLFRMRYMQKKARGFGYEELPGASSQVLKAIRHLIYRLEAPPPCNVIYRDVYTSLSERDQCEYANFKRDSVANLDGKEITAINAGALVAKLSAWASGGQYFDDGDERIVLRPHYEKRNKLLSIFRKERGPFLVFYWFNFSVDDIKAAARAAELSFSLFDTRKPEIVERWNEGGIDVLAAHPQSAGMGLNLQRGGHKIIWVTIPWSSELWLQSVARLARRGQDSAVEVTRIITPNTIDERISHVLGNKIDTQKLILDEIKERLWN